MLDACWWLLPASFQLQGRVQADALVVWQLSSLALPQAPGESSIRVDFHRMCQSSRAAECILCQGLELSTAPQKDRVAFWADLCEALRHFFDLQILQVESALGQRLVHLSLSYTLSPCSSNT